MSSLPLHAWRALHSFAVECALSYTDPRAAEYLLVERVGMSLRAFSTYLERGVTRLQVVLEPEGGVRVRVLVLGDDDQWVGLCRPRACELGVDEAALAVLTRTAAVLDGVEPLRLSWDDTGGTYTG